MALGVVVLTAASVALSACGGLADKTGSGAGGDENYLIGLATPLTGDLAEIGKNSKRGAEMAIADINAAGGFAGRRGELVVQDDAGKPATGVNAVARLTQESGVRFLLGPDLSTVTLAALETSRKAEIPQLTSSISPAVTAGSGGWLFRARPSDATNVEIMIQYGVEKLKLKRIAVLYGLDAYGQGALPVIQRTAKESSANVVMTQGVTPGAKDMTAQITAVKAAKADGILWWGVVPESAVLQKAIKQLGYGGALFGANALVNASTINLSGEAADGSIAATTFVGSDPDPQSQEFVRKYKKAYGEEPNDHAPLYYDMVKAVAEAARKAGSTEPAKVRDAMRQVTYDAITGTMKWDAKGEYTSRSAVIVRIADGAPLVVGRSG
jgi:branched-chain amino acid transport system substrate-binding protein